MVVPVTLPEAVEQIRALLVLALADTGVTKVTCEITRGGTVKCEAERTAPPPPEHQWKARK